MLNDLQSPKNTFLSCNLKLLKVYEYISPSPVVQMASYSTQNLIQWLNASFGMNHIDCKITLRS